MTAVCESDADDDSSCPVRPTSSSKSSGTRIPLRQLPPEREKVAEAIRRHMLEAMPEVQLTLLGVLERTLYEQGMLEGRAAQPLLLPSRKEEVRFATSQDDISDSASQPATPTLGKQAESGLAAALRQGLRGMQQQMGLLGKKLQDLEGGMRETGRLIFATDAAASNSDDIDHDPAVDVSPSSNLGGAPSLSPSIRQRIFDMDPSNRIAQRKSRLSAVGYVNPLNWLLMRLADLILLAMTIKEPPRSGKLASFVQSTTFETLCAQVICVHALFTAYSADYSIEYLNQEVKVWMLVMEAFFAAFYILELTLKMLVHRLYFFCNEDMSWNIFDFLLVVFGLIDQYTMLVLANEGGRNSLTFMRSIRLVRLVKILRVLRVMRFFRELRLMIYSIMYSLSSFFWCFVMIFFVLYVFALVIIQGVAGSLEQMSPDNHEFSALMSNFGSMTQTMLSLYMATTGGVDWREYHNDLLPVGDGYSVLFLAYTAFFNFAVYNVLTGIFVERAMSVAEPGRDGMILELRRKERAELEQVRRLCHAMDFDNSGSITWAEFSERLENETVKACLQSIGLDVKDAYMFFTTLTEISGDGKVDIDAFCEGCMKMKGQASSIDLAALAFEAKLIRRDVDKAITMLDRNTKILFQGLQEVRRSDCRSDQSRPSQDGEHVPDTPAGPSQEVREHSLQDSPLRNGMLAQL
mmetsp:Transcript_9666/g.21562  ORF Transcript_9666/g.21562 Transcript_9666/m.21562 type:complete len:691 (-) Transcript_9666:128-2200(-)